MQYKFTILQHLTELRKKLIISLFCVGIASAASLPFSFLILKALKLPAAGLIDKLAFFAPSEAFSVYMRISLFCGLALSMPVIFYQAAAFILPSFGEPTKKRVMCGAAFCFFAFLSGCAFAYFILIPPALKFLLSFAKDELVPVISAEKYLSFVLTVVFSCGLIFQMPVLSFFLTRLNVIDHRILRSKYRYAIVAIFICAAVITPTTDVFNLFLLAVPMLGLYEVSVWSSWLGKK